MSARMEAAMLRHAIERCPRAVRHPARAITAPEPQLVVDFIDESLRLAQFAQSAATRDGVVAPFPGPATAAHPNHPQQAVAGFSFNNRSNQ